jgi:uncharacterized protein (TIGR02594 family)
MKTTKTLAYVLLATVALYVAIPNTANARPTTDSSSVQVTEQQVKKKVVKKKKKKIVKKAKKQTAIVQELTPDQLKGKCYENAGDSAAAFFACDDVGKSIAKVFVSEPSEPAKTNTAKKGEPKTYSFFSSSPNKNIISEASKLEGLHARKDKEVIKKYLKASNTNEEPVDPTRIPWCAAFANAVLRRTGFEGTESLQARSFLSWGQKTTKPEEGDVVVLKRGRSNATGHVGFFSGYEWYGSQLYVKVLGGNQNKSVNVAYFPVNYVLGYRRPV